ncbi:MAG TPA: hypothetical protein VEH04_19695 [Verrucomicrobiae bacterium]|nr:hypothetical protein [Verrucomicrobiae bacterium]
MFPQRRAVIDVGTNSVKLLVADVANGEVRPLIEESKQTRLGSGFYESQRLQPEPIAKTAKAVRKFATHARDHGALSVRVIATSAARDAVNAEELISAIQEASRLNVEVISGEQEADWAFRGVTTDPRFSQCPLLMFDVGGGSTEFILGEGSHQFFRQSFPIGTVRLLEKLPRSDPPATGEKERTAQWIREFLEREALTKLDAARQAFRDQRPDAPAFKLIGTGGSTTILSRMELEMADFDRGRIEANPIPRERIRWHGEHLWSMPFAKRQQIAGLPPKRADVILNGVLVCETVMELIGFNELWVSTRGLRFAALMH